jgi:predicted GTPase
LLSDLQHAWGNSHCLLQSIKEQSLCSDDNDVCVQLVMRHQGDGATGSALARIRYITQVKSRPPTFAVFVSGGLAFPENARRFLTRALQKDFEFEGVPIRAEMRYRKRKQNAGQPKRSPIAANQQSPVVQKRAARQAA